MKNRPVVVLALVSLLLGGSAILARRGLAQDTGADFAKRKIRSKVTPIYPAVAKQMHVTGRVKIEVTVNPEGRVSATRVIGGSPLLVEAAVSALEEWRFEPGPKETVEIYEFQFDPQE